MFQNIQNNKMAERQVAAAIIAVLLLDDDDIKKRGKTHSWIKKAKTEVQEKFLSLIEPFISPQESYHGVDIIKATKERLTLTLRLLATGEILDR